MVLVDGRAVVLGTSTDGMSTTITTVDLADPTSPTVVDATTVSGRASAVRLHDDVVRVVLQNGLPELDFSAPDGTLGQLRARLRNRALVRDTTLADWLPTVDGAPVVDCEDVAIPDDDLALGTTTLLAFDPAEPTARTTTAVATDSAISYFSTDRFYLAASAPQWGWVDCMGCRPAGFPGPDGTTPLFAFALDGTDASYVASGEVEGTIADRWSMDAVGGSLRVAVGPSSETGNFNSVVTLREEGSDLVEDGRVDQLGVGEQIKSVRWFDDLAIVVTFRQTDPLYAIDLSDPDRAAAGGRAEDPRLLRVPPPARRAAAHRDGSGRHARRRHPRRTGGALRRHRPRLARASSTSSATTRARRPGRRPTRASSPGCPSSARSSPSSARGGPAPPAGSRSSRWPTGR